MSDPRITNPDAVQRAMAEFNAMMERITATGSTIDEALESVKDHYLVRLVLAVEALAGEAHRANELTESARAAFTNSKPSPDLRRVIASVEESTKREGEEKAKSLLQTELPLGMMTFKRPDGPKSAG